MRLLIDAVSTDEGDGGPFVHARESLRAWKERHPGDALLVVGPQWVAAEISDTNWEHFPWSSRNRLTRAVGHHVVVPWLAWRRSAHATLTTLPVVSPLNRCARRYCYAHDWRHLTQPAEFSLLQRLYRTAWRHSVIASSATFCISRKTLRETTARWANVRAVLAENGVDHTRRWGVKPSSEQASGMVLTFGHRKNKRPELAIGALAAARNPRSEDMRLVVVGAQGEYREQLNTLAVELGVADRCEFPGYVPEPQLHQLFVEAEAVMLLSTDEGFGLPAGEALSLGVPVIAASDGGLGEVFGPAVMVSPPEPLKIAEALGRALDKGSDPQTQLPTWGEAIDAVRQTILADAVNC